MKMAAFSMHTKNVRDAFKVVMQRVLPIMETKLADLERNLVLEGKADGLGWLGVGSMGDLRVRRQVHLE
jgi:hypothetical protein